MSVACPICRAPDSAACSRGRDRLFGLAKGTFELFRCPSCESVFLHPLPDESTIAEFYPPEYWWSEESEGGSLFARIFGRLERVYREFVVADHVRFLNFCAHRNGAGEKSLLDMGCGSGTFLHGAQSHGFIPHGMDVSAKAVQVAQKQYGFPVRQGGIGQNVWGGRRFNFVTMFHVLEHLPDPRMALKYAGGLLQPDGTLIIQVPNIVSLQARIFGKLWYGLDVPRHLINFSPKALGFLLQETGYKFQLVSRFSLRDNPASIASSLALWLDPLRRKVRRAGSGPIFSGLLEFAYFGLFLLALPAAYLESVCGRGGTIWAYAQRKDEPQ